MSWLVTAEERFSRISSLPCPTFCFHSSSFMMKPLSLSTKSMIVVEGPCRDLFSMFRRPKMSFRLASFISHSSSSSFLETSFDFALLSWEKILSFLASATPLSNVVWFLLLRNSQRHHVWILEPCLILLTDMTRLIQTCSLQSNLSRLK